jgi:hypothetical protein
MADDKALAIVDSDSGQEGSNLVFNVEFVNMNVTSQADRQRNQKVIRSTAMKSFRRKQQLQRLQEKEGSRQDVIIGNKEAHSKSKTGFHSDARNASPGSNSGWSSVATVPDVSWLVSVLPSSNSGDSGYPPGESSQTGPFISRSLRTLPIASNPTSLLGAGRIDPFRIQPVDTGSHIHELIDHCEFGPVRKNYSSSGCDFAWQFLTLFCQQRSIFYGQVFVLLVY